MLGVYIKSYGWITTKFLVDNSSER